MRACVRACVRVRVRVISPRARAQTFGIGNCPVTYYVSEDIEWNGLVRTLEITGENG